MTPTFAVVGHPNKGKSSIVATLAQNDSIQIAMQPGTTRDSHHYPMQVDDQVLYHLVDTPGFQRARRALAWLQQHSQSAADRRDTVAAFVQHHQGLDKFHDECELLKPILEGAGIIYVVDGSSPYGAEYEAEMEILRWTGQPSMALINPIRSDAHIAQWQTALSQFFRTVRVFNARTAEFDKHLSLLRCFGQLEESWEAPLDSAIDHLKQQHDDRREDSAQRIATLLINALGHKESIKLPEGAPAEQAKAPLEKAWRHAVRKEEQQARRDIESLYQHHRLERQETELDLDEEDLFAMDHWYLWGLGKRELMALAAGTGAATGALADLGLGGTSFMLGALGGGIAGGVGAWFFSDDLAKLKLKGKLPLGGQQVTYGPSTHRNFPWVLLGRALYHWQSLIRRNHAWREAFTPEIAPQDWQQQLSTQQKLSLEKAFYYCRKREDEKAMAALLEHLPAIMTPLDINT
ncbi:GTPase/DUF3482 domain-containing protein [Pokkaliibacter sp. CJK22405]|uniref:GTPase/DUF3482 domain-containing protein n=1 Tax=Pokkaliibacter sp. CJK22405 TaxID=3384615 RepID=UPI003984ED9F